MLALAGGLEMTARALPGLPVSTTCSLRALRSRSASSPRSLVRLRCASSRLGCDSKVREDWVLVQGAPSKAAPHLDVGPLSDAAQLRGRLQAAGCGQPDHLAGLVLPLRLKREDLISDVELLQQSLSDLINAGWRIRAARARSLRVGSHGRCT